MGTSDDDGIWLNRSDPAGTIMSCLVWFLIGYSTMTMTFLAQTGGIPVIASVLYGILSSSRAGNARQDDLDRSRIGTQ